MKSLPVHDLSPEEYLYLSSCDLVSPFAIQMVIKGKGVLTKDILEAAIQKGPFPGKIEYLNYWDEHILERPVTLKKEAFFEVILCQEKEDITLVFRASHCLTDAKGLVLYVKEIFSFLNKKNSDNCDYLKRTRSVKLPYSRRSSLSFKCLGFDKKEDRSTSSYKKTLLTLAGRHSSLVASLALGVRKLLAPSPSDPCTVMIPVDARQSELVKNNQHFFNNLAFPLFLDLEEESGSNGLEKIYTKILTLIDNQEHLKRSPLDFFLPYIPTKLLRFGMKKIDSYQKKNHRFLVSAIISFIGSFNLEEWSTNTFTAIDIYFHTINSPIAPLTIVATEVYHQKYKIEKTHLSMSFFTSKDHNSLAFDLIQKALLPLPINIDLIDRILYHATTRPHHRAICDSDNKTYSYAQLGQIIGDYKKNPSLKKTFFIKKSRSIEAVLEILQAISLSRPFIPIDPHYPLDRQHMIEDDFKNDIPPDNIVYILYTSGTTGKPKGVMITKENLGTYLSFAASHYLPQKKGEEVLALYTSLSFDLSITMLFLPFIYGDTLKVGKEDLPHLMMKELIQDKEITITKLTPSHLKIIKDLSIKPNALWKTLIVGGENFQTSLANSIQKLFGPQLGLFNEYGPTETTVGCSVHRFDPAIDIGEENVPIGLPGLGMWMGLSDEEELLIQGLGVSPGFWKRDQKILQNDHYHTGDSGYLKKDLFHCRGRKDQQIKVSGHRLELEEIVLALESFPGLSNAFVLYEDLLVAFYTTADKEISCEKLQTYLEGKLPSKAIPKYFIILATIPLTVHGKIDTHVLKTIFHDVRSDKSLCYEEALWKRWQEADSLKKLHLLHEIDQTLYKGEKFSKLLEKLPFVLLNPSKENFYTLVSL